VSEESVKLLRHIATQDIENWVLLSFSIELGFMQQLETCLVLPSFSVAILPFICCHDNMLHSDLQVGRQDAWQR